MSKLFIKPKNKIITVILFIFIAISQSYASDPDADEDFTLEGDNFKNLPKVIGGETKIKYWGNVSIKQGSLKIDANEAIIYNGKNGISKVLLKGSPVKMEKRIDQEFGKIFVNANNIDFMVQKDLLKMTGNVIIKSKIQGEMRGEKINMNLKTKEISGVKSENTRVKLIIKSKSKSKQ